MLTTSRRLHRSDSPRRHHRRALTGVAAMALALGAAGCGGEDDSAATSPAGADAAAAQPGVRVVSVDAAASLLADPPADLIVLDVRTPDEFAEARIDGAEMIDFYEPDFADQLAELDRDVPYVLYCRSGNRSSQVREMMTELGFADVSDIDGGILSWVQAGQPVVSG